MSFFEDAISALIKPARQFGTNSSGAPFVAQITISEAHSDDCDITSHPVEAGPNVSDHIISLAPQLVVRMGFTDYGLQSPSTYIQQAICGGSVATPNSIGNVYAQLLNMQSQHMPFVIVTAKRSYPSMVIRSLSTETDERTANSLIITARCQAIILVQSQIITVPPNSAQANPSATASPVSNGTKQLAPAPTSVAPP